MFDIDTDKFISDLASHPNFSNLLRGLIRSTLRDTLKELLEEEKEKEVKNNVVESGSKTIYASNQTKFTTPRGVLLTTECPSCAKKSFRVSERTCSHCKTKIKLNKYLNKGDDL
jgi:ribosomal protein L37E